MKIKNKAKCNKKNILKHKNKELDLSREEVLLLMDAFSAFNNRLDEDEKKISTYIDYAHITGDIASGDGIPTEKDKKYSENIKFFEVKDNIKEYINQRKTKAYQLINKIIFSNKNFV